MILAEGAARVEAQAAAARAQAVNAGTDALIAHLNLEIEKLRRALYGSRSERTARLLEQLELQLEDLETAATEDGWRLRERQPELQQYARSSASGLRANPSPIICRVSAWFIRFHRPAHAAAAPCTSWARM